MRTYAWILLLCSTAFPALAAGWEEILQDTDMFEQSLTEDADWGASMQEDTDVWSSDELLPSDEVPAEEEPAPTHIAIKVDGVPVTLTDVPAGEWFAPFVRDVAERGLISGYRGADGRPTGLYGPADDVTVGQLAKLAVQAAGIDVYSCAGTLKNASAKDNWSEQYVLCAETKSWAVFSDGSADVLRPATRAEVVVTVLQAFGARIPPRSGTLFTDVTTATTYGAAIEAAANAKIVAGYTDTQGKSTGLFGPEDAVNRAQAAKIFSLAFQVYGS